MTKAVKQITRATIKAFIKTHSKCLYAQPVTLLEMFNGMVNPPKQDGFKEVSVDLKSTNPNTLGVSNYVWLTQNSKNYYNYYEHDNYSGYIVDNSCGSFIIARKINPSI